MANHHLPEDWIQAYAAGTLPPAESLLVESHASLCPLCREKIEAAEDALGAMLLTTDIMSRPDSLLSDETNTSGSKTDGLMGKLDALMDRLDEPPPPEAPPKAVPFDPKGILPAPIFEKVGDLDQHEWMSPLPGVELLPLPGAPEDRFAHLARIQPGVVLPRHRHPGFESTLVLSGGFVEDGGAQYARGDVSMRDDSAHHSQTIDDGEPCLWLLVAHGPFIVDPE